MISLFEKLDTVIKKITNLLLVVTISAMLVFSFLAIVTRWMQMPIQWIDPLVRHLVFVCTFLAGILITGADKHMAIDILQKYLEDKPLWQKKIKRVIYIVSSITILWIAYASFVFLQTEIEYGVVGFLNIHSAFWVSIIPIGFLLIAFRFFFRFLATFKNKEAAL